MKLVKLIFFAAVLFVGFFYWQMYTSVLDEGESIFFKIAPKEEFEKVASRLEDKKLIRNKTLFGWYAELTGLDKEVKAGRFQIDLSLSPSKILQFLANPENGEISVTIPEGFSVFDIDKKLASLGLIQKNEFTEWAQNADFVDFPFVPENSAEGFLFPDTYFVFSKNFHPEDLGFSMLRNFEKKIIKSLGEKLKENKRSLVEIISLASILEKEVRTKEDYPLVAGILWKRLDHEWPLQADATLLYGDEDRKLSSADLKKDSPYNTYTRRGLPETPIGNPGLVTIEAALHPKESPYWFYLTTKEGTVIYARTNEEQNSNKRKYL